MAFKDAFWRIHDRFQTPIWLVLVFVYGIAVAAFGAKYQAVRKDELHANLTLASSDTFLATLPTGLVFFIIFGVTLLFLYFMYRVISSRKMQAQVVVQPATDAERQHFERVQLENLTLKVENNTLKRENIDLKVSADEARASADPLAAAVDEAKIAGLQHRIEVVERERNAARSEIEKLKAQITFPRFVASVNEIVPSDPVISSDLSAVIFVNIANFGADSVVQNLRVVANTVFGTKINVDVTGAAEFPLIVENGTQCLDFSEEHYIFTRTRHSAVRRGHPVDGVIPCIFHGVTDVKEIDLRSLRVQFTDGTGNPEGGAKWWETAGFSEITYEDAPPKWRVGFPRPRQIKK